MIETNYKLSTKAWRLFRILMMVAVFFSLKCWVLWDITQMTMSFLYLVLALPFFINKQYWDYSIKRVRISILLFILLLNVAGVGNINLYIFTIITSLPLFSIVLLREEYLSDLLNFFQRILALFLAVSAFFWILHLVGFDIPSTDVTYGKIENYKGEVIDQYYFANHYLYLVNNSWFMRYDSEIPSFFRFSSVFLEPGYLGIMMTFMLFINRFDMKDRRNQVYFVVLLFTLSLAGYLMTTFAFIAHKMQHSTNRVFMLIGIGLFLTSSYFFFTNYNGGNNAINTAIISRLELDEEKGIVGNNRSSETMDQQFEEFLASPELIFGVRDSKLLEFGVGYKAYLIKNGLVGFVLFIFFIVWIARLSGNYRSSILCVLYLLMFARGHLTIFWPAMVFIYIAGVLQTKE